MLNNRRVQAQRRLEANAPCIAEDVRAGQVVCSTRTDFRIAGRSWWKWVYVGAASVLHLIQPSLGKAAPQEMVGETRPGFWVLETFRAQHGDAERWQMCLTHLLCDTQLAVDCGDAILVVPLKRLLLSATAIERR